MKKLLKILLGIFAVCLAIVAVFVFLGGKMVVNAMTAYDQIQSVDLQSIPDGTYEGKAGEFIILADLSVTVKDGRMTEINMLRQVCASDYRR